MSKTKNNEHVSYSLAILLMVVFGSVWPLGAREKSDVIVMKNGDKITGEIKSLRSNTLSISVDYVLDTLSVDWSEVDHVASKQLFIVKTQDGSVYTGLISIPKTLGGRPVHIELLEAPEKEFTLQRKEVVDVRQTSTNFWQRLNGEIGLGSTYTKGNKSTQYNLNTQVNYVEERWSTGVDYISNLNSNAGTSTSTRNNLTFSARRLTRWKKWYYTGLADFFQSSTQGITSQNTFGGGIGRDVKNTGATFFTVYGGFAWQRIRYNQAIISADTQQITTGLIGTNLRLFRFDRTTLTVRANLQPATSELGRLHFKLDSTYYVKLWGKLNWNVTFYGNWDNRPPPGFSGGDYGTTTGLSMSFGNR